MPAAWSKFAAVFTAASAVDSVAGVSLRAAGAFARSPHQLLPTPTLVDIGAGVLDGDAGSASLSAAVATAKAASVAAQAAERNAEVAAKEAFTAEKRNKLAAQSLQQDMDMSSYLGGDMCDVTSSGGPVCFAGQQAALLPPAVLPGLVGRYTFDEKAAVDSSGYGHHGGSDFAHSPSPSGIGHGAAFKKSFVTIPHSEELLLKDFTYTFWMFLPEEEVGEDAAESSAQWCPLLRKGVHVPTAREFQNAPVLMLSPVTGQLRFAASTKTTMAKSDGEYVDSNARILPNRWIHIAAVHHSRKLLLYVNGILDAVTVLKADLVPNTQPLYVGGDPFTSEMCGHLLYFDELRVHNHAVTPHELQAEAAPALGGADPSFVHFGCIQCSLMEAAKSCPASRHICSSLELHTGAYQVARSLGWIRSGSHIWTLAALQQAQKDPLGQTKGNHDAAVGLGLCCEGETAHT
eukprot:TRINITY_DN123480_c0_g1_i1.p1 TRINITY_DN123480_c0_g1~~TRINITY_DN123480_c0_g1_i1.p1  ORF type:complete len:461 (+),score=118.01 TRINITY_DN123480_c0_g1_i1:128-1510(+)